MSGTKSLTPRLRFPEFREAGSWEEKRLGDVCNILNNLRQPITGSDRVKGEYPYYGASGIVDYVNDYIFDERLLLVGEDGAKWGAFEKTAFIVDGKYWVNNHAHVLRPTGIRDTLLENYLTMIDIGPFITGAAPPKLTLGMLRNIPIPVPKDKAEQQKIADCLSSLDDLITARARKVAALERHKKGLMQQLFPATGQTTPQLRFPEFREAGAWVSSQLGKHCSITTGRLDANAMKENGRYRFYTCAKDYYHIDDYAFDTDALLISGNGANLGYIHHYKGKFNAYQRTYVLDKFDQEIVFIKYLLEQSLHIRIAMEKKDGNTPYIVMSTLTEMDVLIPSPPEQQKIAECLTSVDDLIRAEAQKLDALKAHKKGLMQQLFPNPDGGAP